MPAFAIAHLRRPQTNDDVLEYIEFPDVQRARGWYQSPAYQEILPLRTRHIEGSVNIVDGVPDDYDPADTAARLRQAAASEPG
jgi:hypothetical protein